MGPRERKPGAGTIWRRTKDNLNPDQLLRIGTDPRLGSELARLYLFGVITQQQFSAGLKYAEIVGRYDKYHGITRRQVASPSYERGRGEDGEVERRTRDGTMSAYERAARKAVKERDKVLRVLEPAHVREFVDEVCIWDRAIATSLHGDLARVLTRICGVLGFTGATQRPTGEPTLRDVAVVRALAERLSKGLVEAGHTVGAYSLEVEPERTRLMLYSVPVDGTVVTKFGDLPHDSALLAARLHSLLVKEAERRGWTEKVS